MSADINAFNKRVQDIIRESEYLYKSPDFQTDQTGGFPVSLCVAWDKGYAWLELNYGLAYTVQDISPYEQDCAAFGVHKCVDIRDYNALLHQLGRDAVFTAALNEDDEI